MWSFNTTSNNNLQAQAYISSLSQLHATPDATTLACVASAVAMVVVVVVAVVVAVVVLVITVGPRCISTHGDRPVPKHCGIGDQMQTARGNTIVAACKTTVSQICTACNV